MRHIFGIPLPQSQTTSQPHVFGIPLAYLTVTPAPAVAPVEDLPKVEDLPTADGVFMPVPKNRSGQPEYMRLEGVLQIPVSTTPAISYVEYLRQQAAQAEQAATSRGR